jgi:Rps23 Pro-64 3,4-dihydroxylase Tpa1-like proline 4-hydroxylase
LKPPSQFRGTKYKEGQYLENHNDNMGNRVLSIVYHMTDNWNSSCGGEFVWNGGIGTLEVAPSYNTLYLFVPRDSSDHRIKDVLCGERLGYSGWLTTDDPAYDFLTMVNMPLWQQRFTRGSMWDVTTDTGLK